MARPERDQPVAWRVGPEWLSLAEALSRVPSAGWPAGFRGRRDAYLLVLLQLGLTRRTAAATATRDISVGPDGVAVRGHLIEADVRSPASCPACATTRWLRIITTDDTWGRNSVHSELVATPDRSGAHDCIDPLPQSWRHVWTLLPAIDRHGWTVDWRPMSLRAMSATVAYRQLRVVGKTTDSKPDQASVAAAFAEPASSPPSGDHELRRMPMAELFDVLDDRIGAADEVLRRIEQELENATSAARSVRR